MIEAIKEAINNAHTICLPIENMSMEELISLVKEAKKSKVEVRLWHETSNFHQGVLVEIQRFHERTDCTHFKLENVKQKDPEFEEVENK